MRAARRLLDAAPVRPAVLALLLLALLASPAAATTVAYIDGNAVWLASADGTQRHQLAGATADGRHWLELTQSDNGRVLAVRREPGKISQLNSFTLWGPDRAVLHEGWLTHQLGWSTYAYPVSLDLTADGRNVVYGYSNMSGIVPNAQFESGTYIIYADRLPASEPFRIPGQKWPTVVGDRLVTAAGTTVSAQRATGQPPFSDEFDPWIDVSGTGLELARADVAATGTVAAVELTAWGDSGQSEGKIAMIPFAGLGGAIAPGDCYLPTQGLASDASLSQDGTLVAWEDDRGVVVAGVPDFSGAEPCTLTRPPVVISATGRRPSLGPAALPPLLPPPVPPAGGGAPGGGAAPPSAPGVRLAARVKASALRRGIALRVKVAAAGRITAVGRVGGRVVARGSATAKRAGTVTVRVKATRKARKRLRRLRGKTLVLRVTAGGATATARRTLR
jgi:hypothetical protein